MRPTTILYTVLLLAAPAFTLPLHSDTTAALNSRQDDLDLVNLDSTTPAETIDPSLADPDTPPHLGLNRDSERINFIE